MTANEPVQHSADSMPVHFIHDFGGRLIAKPHRDCIGVGYFSVVTMQAGQSERLMHHPSISLSQEMQFRVRDHEC